MFTFIQFNPDIIQRVRLFLILITTLLCVPVILIASSNQENFHQGNNTNKGFIENKGQIIDQNNKPNPAVLYLLNTPGMNVQLRKGGFSYDLYTISNRQTAVSSQQTADSDSQYAICSPQSGVLRNASHVTDSILNYQFSIVNYHRIDFDLSGCNLYCEIIASEPGSCYMNYYTAGTPAEGATFVRSYKKVLYKDIYPGIDLEFILDEKKGFEYNFRVHPGGDIADVQIRISGPEKIKELDDGLRFKTTICDVDEQIPLCYYRINDKSYPAIGKITKSRNGFYGFYFSETIPKIADLYIDPIPTRRWGTYYGGEDMDWFRSNSITLDNLGDIVTGGTTWSTTNIATAGAFQTILNGQFNAFISKFSTNGQQEWGTYYGGYPGTDGYGCSVDKSGNIFLAGITFSQTNIATPGAFQTVLCDSSDAFLVKFNTTGQRIWGTYYGGHEKPPPSGLDQFWACATDTSGNVYCAGQTTSPDFIATPGAEQTTLGGLRDAFFVKFTGDGQRVWGTYYGGSDLDQGLSCGVSKNGVVYFAGNTSSPNNIATPGSFLPTYSGRPKGFLACFNFDGQRLWGTYFGGTSVDGATACTIDTGNNVYLYGVTESTTNIATPGSFQPNMIPSTHNQNGYLEKFDETGARLWGTYMGWCSVDGGAVDDSAYLYITGGAWDEPPLQNLILSSPGAYQSTIRDVSGDAYLEKFSSNGQRIWGTFYGGTGFGGSYGFACATDSFDNIYFAGNTADTNYLNINTNLCTRKRIGNYIATPGSHQPYNAGFTDAFLVKFADCYSPDTALQIYGPSILCQNSTGAVFSIDPIITVTYYHWCVSANLTITSGQGSTAITVDVGPVLGIDTISVYGINACDTGYPIVITRGVYAWSAPVINGPDSTCAGAEIQYSTAGGKNAYQWTISPGGIIISGGTATDSICTVTWNVAGSQWIRVNYIDTNGCRTSIPTQFNVWVNAIIVDVSITASANPVCTGTLVNYTAIPVNGGSSPAYQWKVNGFNSGTNDSVFTYAPANNDVVNCIVTSSNTICVLNNPATSNSITMTVNPLLPVSVTVTALPSPSCEGIPVTFTAHPVNGGNAPHYQWKVNGINAGTDSVNYTYIPVNGDLISCILNSSELCTSNNPATSAPYQAVVIPPLPVSITIGASENPFCIGDLVTFTATPTYGGTTPVYQWQVNGINVGSGLSTYTYIPVGGDVVDCIMTSSLLCVTGNPATSNSITMVVNTGSPAGVTINASSNPFCPGSTVTFMATPNNGGSNPVYQWKVNGINVGTNSNTYSYNPTDGDSVRCIMTSNLSCVTNNPASSAEIIMSGTLAPVVTFTACFDTITTINAKPIKLKGGIPLGGVYSGPGVNSLTGVYAPSIAGVGTHTITYTYTNAALCSAHANAHIINFQLSIFNCGNPLTDIRDGKVYPTVQIGSQCWMAANLNYGTMIPGASYQRDNCVAEKYCYNDLAAVCGPRTYYQWDELMQYDDTPADQGFCPPGWHVPTENDWLILFSNYINNAFAGSPLKYSGYSGFNALLSGSRHLNKSWDYQGFAAFFWSSTSHGPAKAWAHGMNDVDASVSYYPAVRTDAFSVRCLKD